MENPWRRRRTQAVRWKLLRNSLLLCLFTGEFGLNPFLTLLRLFTSTIERSFVFCEWCPPGLGNEAMERSESAGELWEVKKVPKSQSFVLFSSGRTGFKCAFRQITHRSNPENPWKLSQACSTVLWRGGRGKDLLVVVLVSVREGGKKEVVGGVKGHSAIVSKRVERQEPGPPRDHPDRARAEVCCWDLLLAAFYAGVEC